MSGAGFNSAMYKLQGVRRARRQFDLDVCWMTSTKSEHRCNLASNMERLPDCTYCILNLRLNVPAIAIFLLVDIQGGKRHRNCDEEDVYGEVHTRADPPTITKRICEWVPELLCLFVLRGLHEATGVKSKGFRVQGFIVEDVPGVGKKGCTFLEVVTCAD